MCGGFLLLFITLFKLVDGKLCFFILLKGEGDDVFLLGVPLFCWESLLFLYLFVCCYGGCGEGWFCLKLYFD